MHTPVGTFTKFLHHIKSLFEPSTFNKRPNLLWSFWDSEFLSGASYLWIHLFFQLLQIAWQKSICLATFLRAQQSVLTFEFNDLNHGWVVGAVRGIVSTEQVFWSGHLKAAVWISFPTAHVFWRHSLNLIEWTAFAVRNLFVRMIWNGIYQTVWFRFRC